MAGFGISGVESSGVDHSGRAVLGMKAVFASSNTGIVGSNPSSGMDVCVRLFCVCALLCVQVAALRRADPPSKESYRLCKRSRN
jgi:hypothetical protein